MNPAQLNTKIQFYGIETQQNIYAGSTIANEPLLCETWAQKLPVMANNQFAIDAGVSNLNYDAIFRIRQRHSFTPIKSMYIMHSDMMYVVNAIRPVDEPIRTNGIFHSTNYLEIIGVHEK